MMFLFRIELKGGFIENFFENDLIKNPAVINERDIWGGEGSKSHNPA